jgi:glyoxylase-like metal-dependent hydrolase (beta-lactamase superfamily II)
LKRASRAATDSNHCGDIRDIFMIEIQQTGEVYAFRLARTLMGRGLYYTAAYWVDGLMVDTGCAYTDRELVSALDGFALRLIVNTHSHEDHIGGNAALEARFGAKILIHPSGLPVLADPRRMRSLRPYQLIMWGYPESSTGGAIGDKVETENHLFHVLHTPGHSVDHICLYEAERGWLFSGDAYIGGYDRALRADYNIWDIIASLKKMSRLEVKRLFPGSGRVREEAGVDLSEKVAYLEDIAGQVLALHQRGWDYSRIRREIFGRELAIAYFTLGHFSGKQLVRSIVEDRPAS